jgi:hypothetical protein
MNRRKFLGTTSLVGSGLALGSIESLAVPQPVKASAGFGLKVLATSWGFN